MGASFANLRARMESHLWTSQTSEGRLVFALNMDGFNPSARRRNGRAASISGIYLVCLNLPPSIRYKVENVFLVGIVPGPHEPSTHQVNHLLHPLVGDLLSLWSPGMYLKRTTKYPDGRLIKGCSYTSRMRSPCSATCRRTWRTRVQLAFALNVC
jgi:hypothetical protein